MAKAKKIKVETGSNMAPESYYIKVTSDGPYLVYGNPPIDQEIILPNEEGSSWVYRKGKHFTPTETNNKLPLLEDAEEFEGPTMILADNEKYCAFARFCDAYGRIWNLVQEAKTEEEKEIVRHEAGHCPAGRLVLWDKEKEKVFEPPFEPSIGIIEDPGIKVSGPIWVKGGIRIESADGTSYEIRNRVTLCRCGQSSNKPFCDGTHASMEFRDGIPFADTDKEW